MKDKANVKTLSDLDLAIMLEDQFGTENLIKAPSGIWHFTGLIWRLLSDDELKPRRPFCSPKE
jgi:putative DNA primase/helicase